MEEKLFKKSDIQKNSRVLIGGAFSLTLSTIIVKILGLFYKIPLSLVLGDEGMGYFNSAYTVYAFFYLLCTAGVPKAVMLMVSGARARGKELEEKQIVRVALSLFLSLGTVVCVIFILFSRLLADLIGNSESAATMIGIAPSIIFISLSGVIRGYLTAEMKLLEIAVSQIVEGVGKLVLGLAFANIAVKLSLPLNIISAFTILGVTFGAILGLVYLVICSKTTIFDKKAWQKIEFAISRQISRRILSISIPITLSAAVMSLTNIIDLGLIMNSLAEIGYSEGQSSALYGNYTTLAVPMLNLAISLITPITLAYLPTFSEAALKEDREALISSQKSTLKVVAFLSAPMTVGFMFFSREILDLLFKNSDTEIGGALLCILAPSILFSSLLIIVNTILEAYGFVKAPLISMLCGSGIKIIASRLLITYFGFGILGAPLGTVISYGVALAVSLIIYSLKIKENIPIFSTTFLPYIFAFFAVRSSRAIYEKTMKTTEGLLFSILFAALIYLGLYALLTLFRKRKERKLAKSTKMS